MRARQRIHFDQLRSLLDGLGLERHRVIVVALPGTAQAETSGDPARHGSDAGVADDDRLAI